MSTTACHFCLHCCLSPNRWPGFWLLTNLCSSPGEQLSDCLLHSLPPWVLGLLTVVDNQSVPPLPKNLRGSFFSTQLMPAKRIRIQVLIAVPGGLHTSVAVLTMGCKLCNKMVDTASWCLLRPAEHWRSDIFK